MKTIVKIKASIPGMGGSEGTISFKDFDEAMDYITNKMFCGPEGPYMAVVPEEDKNMTLMITHGGMSFALNIKEDTTPPKELGE